ncbi:LysR family transcriptional regulator [Actinomadura sp. ATCC 31491]|uniref:LysR family transcriptional regulator n=1 Tax=Actinomadura luzonensis TaxID=2805427 RepID=A0ABT0FVL0_9ACTN|nr:LysR family transcriptional regulator [Actinomadura luzonensis]MCK2216015.1 LysR family transcriptional regulator [Actinomadura luzonensis]
MTLSQLGAFVFVARLGSVKAAARALGVSEPAVSQSLGQLRRHLGDPLLTRSGDRMVLTEGGRRLLGIASRMVALGAEAMDAVRPGRPARLHVVMDAGLAEYVAGPLLCLFTQRKPVDATSGVAATAEVPLLLSSRLADVALGAQAGGDGLVSRPVLRCRLIVVGAPRGRRDHWLVGPSGADPASDTSRLLRLLRVPESQVRVYANQSAAWKAAAEGAGLAPATAHLVSAQLRRGALIPVDTPATPLPSYWYATTLDAATRSAAAGTFLDFLTTPSATQTMRTPDDGIPRNRFRPPVHVSIWS